MIIIDEDKYVYEKYDNINHSSFRFILKNNANKILMDRIHVTDVYQIRDHDFIVVSEVPNKKHFYLEHIDIKLHKTLLHGEFETCDNIHNHQIWLLQKNKQEGSIIYNSWNQKKYYFPEYLSGMTLKEFPQKGQMLELTLILIANKKFDKLRIGMNPYTLEVFQIYSTNLSKIFPINKNSIFKNSDEVEFLLNQIVEEQNSLTLERKPKNEI